MSVACFDPKSRKLLYKQKPLLRKNIPNGKCALHIKPWFDIFLAIKLADKISKSSPLPLPEVSIPIRDKNNLDSNRIEKCGWHRALANTSAIFHDEGVSCLSSRMVHRQSWIADDWLGGIYPEVTKCLRGNSDKQSIKPKGCIIRDIFRKASDFCQNITYHFTPRKWWLHGHRNLLVSRKTSVKHKGWVKNS